MPPCTSFVGNRAHYKHNMSFDRKTGNPIEEFGYHGKGE